MVATYSHPIESAGKGTDCSRMNPVLDLFFSQRKNRSIFYYSTNIINFLSLYILVFH